MTKGNIGITRRNRRTQVGTAGAPAFQNGWGNNFPATQLLSYAIDSQGFLHIDGGITDGTPAATSSVVFTLPAGFRPASMQYASAIGVSGTTYVPAMVTVSTAGTVAVGAVGSTLNTAYLGDLTVRLQ
ncbi:MAG: hypothetical protein JXD23_12270 [Spirochaetales bacterium]|nr:hypothetical protein [Spirochaetales bacterium]